MYTKLNIKTQQVIRERVLNQIDPKGSVNLKHPDVTMCAVLVYGESCEQPKGSSYDPIKYVISESTKNKWRKLTHVYIGRDLGEGRRGLVSKFDLEKSTVSRTDLHRCGVGIFDGQSGTM